MKKTPNFSKDFQNVFDSKSYHLLMSEDFVEYHIFLGDSENVTSTTLENLKNDINNFIKPLTKNYIWHRDEFKLKIWEIKNKQPKNKQREHLSSSPNHLYARTYISDNIEDEWFIVFLLLEISLSFPTLIITVSDNDGEFLLIEAANELPKWLAKSSNSINRIFIYKGHLQIVPRSIGTIETPFQIGVSTNEPFSSTNEPSLISSLKIISKQLKETKAEENIEKAAFSRIKEFQSRYINQSIEFQNIQLENRENYQLQEQHKIKCFLPSSLAYLLKKKPNLIAHAVRYFAYPEPKAMKFSRAMAKFPPFFSRIEGVIVNERTPIDQLISSSVWTCVTFSRFLFAQFKYQQFSLPSIFRLHDKSLNNNNNNNNNNDNDNNNNEGIINSNIKSKIDIEERQKELEEENSINEAKKNGAKIACAFEILYATCSSSKSKSKETLQIIHSIDEILENFSHDEQKTNFASKFDELPSSDSEKWMIIGADEVEDILAQKQNEIDKVFGENKKKENEEKGSEKPMQNSINQIHNFMKKKSDYKGVSYDEDDNEDNNDDDDGDHSSDTDDEFYNDNFDSEEEEGLEGEELKEMKEMKEFMKQMDEELNDQENLANDFEKLPNTKKVDEELNFLKNLLENYDEVKGGSSALSNLMAMMKNFDN